MVELNPCPFCKHVQQQPDTNPDAFARDGKGKFCVVCDECGAMGPMVIGMVQCIDAWNQRALSHPTPVQGEALPVVAEVRHGKLHRYIPNPNSSIADHLRHGHHRLTDHAQATDEIARLQGEVERRDREIARLHDIGTQHTDRLTLAIEELATLRTQLSAALAESGEMRQCLKEAADTLDRCRYSEQPMAKKCFALLARHTTTQESTE
jgi:hypothetical protein